MKHPKKTRRKEGWTRWTRTRRLDFYDTICEERNKEERKWLCSVVSVTGGRKKEILKNMEICLLQFDFRASILMIWKKK